MGNSSSIKQLTPEQILEIQSVNNLSRREIREWYKVFTNDHGTGTSTSNLLSRENFTKNCTEEELPFMNALFDHYVQYGMKEYTSILESMRLNARQQTQGNSDPVGKSSVSTTSRSNNNLTNNAALLDMKRHQYLWQQIQEQQQNADQLIFQIMLPTIEVFMRGNVENVLEWGFLFFSNQQKQTNQSYFPAKINDQALNHTFSMIFNMLDDKYVQLLPSELKTAELCTQYVLHRIQAQQQLQNDNGKVSETIVAFENFESTSTKADISKEEFLSYCNSILCPPSESNGQSEAKIQ
jgi:hypothetical protein